VSQSLVRALHLLDLLAAGTGTLGALAEATGSHKSTVLRLLRDLEGAGFVHRAPDHRYVLGPQLYRLADVALEHVDVLRAAAPRLRDLRDRVGQTVHVAVLDGHGGRYRATYVDKLEPRDAPVRMASRVGSEAVLHCTAVGKVLLAGLSPVDRAEAVATLDLVRRTGRTLVDPDRLLAELQDVADRGWAQDHAENETFVNCVAAPVTGPHGEVLAAVSLSVPDVLLPHEAVLDLVPPLLSATADIARDCGFRPTSPPPGGELP
jgi:DNA-binding IclR family transcriptional regulator